MVYLTDLLTNKNWMGFLSSTAFMCITAFTKRQNKCQSIQYGVHFLSVDTKYKLFILKYIFSLHTDVRDQTKKYESCLFLYGRVVNRTISHYMHKIH